MKRIIIISCLLWVYLPLEAQQQATGFVYHDANKNGTKERKEKGIAGIAVSNGVDVVLTDSKGKYTLSVTDDTPLFVIKPSGYGVPLDENNLPQFFHIHKPNGSPQLRYPGVAPTGDLPKSVDFALYPKVEEDTFTALVFGDSQPYTLEELAFFRKSVVEEAKNEKDIAFGITLGDLVGDALDLHKPYAEVMKAMNMPWYNLMGNHDMNLDAKTDNLSDESFEATFGPANYAFNVGQAHVIVLDDILYPDPRDGQGYWGGFRKDQLDFVENNLKHVDKDRLVILAFHIPLMHQNEDSFRDSDRKRLFDLLSDYANVVAFSAHTHLQRHNFYGSEDGWKGDKPFHEFNTGTTNGDWYSGKLDAKGIPVSTMRDGTSKGYTRLSVDGNQYTLDYQVLGQPKEYQMHVFHPKVVANNRGTQAGIFVNFYMGSKENEVMYRIDGGSWKPMTWIDAPDPEFVRQVMEWDTVEALMPGRRPSNPVNSTHLWRAPIPGNLPEGTHTVEVKATDMFGRTFTQSSSFRSAPPVRFSDN
nr:metallophosphoesterase [Cytophagales bacterium]